MRPNESHTSVRGQSMAQVVKAETAACAYRRHLLRYRNTTKVSAVDLQVYKSEVEMLDLL